MTTAAGSHRAAPGASAARRAESAPAHWEPAALRAPIAIRGVKARAVAAPMKLPLATASGIVDVAFLVLVDLETSAGITGRAYLQAYGKVAVKPMVELVRAMGEMIAGDPLAPFDIEKKLRARLRLLGVHNIVLMAMAGIDMAAWDALAQSH